MPEVVSACALKGQCLRILRLKHRQEFTTIAKSGEKIATKGLVLQVLKTPEGIAGLPEKEGWLRVGFTATKKVGNAVVRNRLKRRLRALASLILPHYAKPGFDYVFIARGAAIDRPFPDLVKDLRYALHQTGTFQPPSKMGSRRV